MWKLYVHPCSKTGSAQELVVIIIYVCSATLISKSVSVVLATLSVSLSLALGSPVAIGVEVLPMFEQTEGLQSTVQIKYVSNIAPKVIIYVIDE